MFVNERTIPGSPLPYAYPTTVQRALDCIRNPINDTDANAAPWTIGGKRWQERVDNIRKALVDSIAAHGVM